MEIKCAYTKLIPIQELKSYSRNTNKHPADQITRLAKLIENHGMRHPVIVSNLSGEVVAGNGRLEALKVLGVKEVPVDYQDFVDEDAEFTFSVSDNAIADWADLDFSMINAELENIGPLDLELFGLKDFVLDLSERGENNVNAEWTGMPEFKQDDLTPVRQLIVSFRNQEDVQAFAEHIGQQITEKTRSLWFPKAEIDRLMDKRY